jgi:hypothetical protein
MGNTSIALKKRRLSCQDLMEQAPKEEAHVQDECWVNVIPTTMPTVISLKKISLPVPEEDAATAVALALKEEEEQEEALVLEEDAGNGSYSSPAAMLLG